MSQCISVEETLLLLKVIKNIVLLQISLHRIFPKYHVLIQLYSLLHQTNCYSKYIGINSFALVFIIQGVHSLRPDILCVVHITLSYYCVRCSNIFSLSVWSLISLSFSALLLTPLRWFFFLSNFSVHLSSDDSES